MSDEVSIEFEPYDSEVVQIEQVLRALNHSRRTKATTVEGWRNEIEQRFAEVGFAVSIVLRQIEEVEIDGRRQKVKDENGQILTTISVTGRLDGMKVGEYDHDRQRAEVRANVRGVAGQAPVDKQIKVPMQGAAFQRSGSGLFVPGSK